MGDFGFDFQQPSTMASIGNGDAAGGERGVPGASPAAMLG